MDSCDYDGPVTRSMHSTNFQALEAPPRVLRLNSSLIEIARDILDDGESEVNAGSEFVLARDVSLDSYLKYVDRCGHLPIRMRLEDGKLLAIELTRRAHAWSIITFAAATRPLYPHARTGTGETVIVGQRSAYNPDVSVTPPGRPQPPPGQGCNSSNDPYPTVVFEIADSQSTPNVCSKVRKYFSVRTSIRIVILIKRFGVYLNGIRALLAMVFNRGTLNPLIPTQTISFGSAPLATSTINSLMTTMNVTLQNFTGLGFGNPPHPCYDFLLSTDRLVLAAGLTRAVWAAQGGERGCSPTN